MSQCHDTPFISLTATVPKSGNSKAFLIDRNKKREETLHDFTYHTTVYRHMKTADDYDYAHAKIPEISVGFFGPEYSGSALEVVQ